MLLLRRLLLVLLLTGLALGCQAKKPSGASEGTSLQKKIKQAQEEPKGPPAPPVRR
jgi:hypothetical protein